MQSPDSMKIPIRRVESCLHHAELMRYIGLISFRAAGQFMLCKISVANVLRKADWTKPMERLARWHQAAIGLTDRGSQSPLILIETKASGRRWCTYILLAIAKCSDVPWYYRILFLDSYYWNSYNNNNYYYYLSREWSLNHFSLQKTILSIIKRRCLLIVLP